MTSISEHYSSPNRTDADPRLQARQKGRAGYLKGLSAEDRIARHYQEQGATLRATRWRGQSGEIDLIFEQNGIILFVEVKASKTFGRAAERLSARQLQRLMVSAEEYLGTCPQGSLTPMRMDLALLDGQGQIKTIENVLEAA